MATTAPAYELPVAGTLSAAEIGNGVWVRPELDETSVSVMLKNLQDWGIQNIYVDVFRSGETLFPSKFFPQKPGAVGRDWLGYIIDESHRHNIRVHAWIQTLCWAEPGPLQYSTTSVLHMHPEWVDLSRDGNAFDGKSMARFVNPGVPEVAARLTSLTMEICQYEVDGLNLDGIHYNFRADMGYHPDMVAEFEASSGVNPQGLERDMARNSNWMRWTMFREDKLTSLVESMSRVCRQEGDLQGRRIMVSAVVQPGYEQNRGLNYRFQNWPDWVKNELLDATTPACFDGDLPGLERQLWEVRSIQMGSDAACIPGFLLDEPVGAAVKAQAPDEGRRDAHPSLANQKRLLRSAGFQYCNIMDYDALAYEKTVQPAPEATKRNGFWGLFRDREPQEK